MDTFATETEANKDKSPAEIKAALQAKAQATQEVTLLSKKCFPFFLPRLSNLKEGMDGKVDFIWIGHHGVLLPLNACFLALYGRLLSTCGMFMLNDKKFLLCSFLPKWVFSKQYIFLGIILTYSHSIEEHNHLGAYIAKFPTFQLLDVMFLTCRRPFMVNTAANCAPGSTAILALICREEYKEKFIFRASKECANNHHTVNLVPCKRFMKLGKVFMLQVNLVKGT